MHNVETGQSSKEGELKVKLSLNFLNKNKYHTLLPVITTYHMQKKWGPSED
jgi:phosphotransferase system IIA component